MLLNIQFYICSETTHNRKGFKHLTPPILCHRLYIILSVVRRLKKAVFKAVWMGSFFQSNIVYENGVIW